MLRIVPDGDYCKHLREAPALTMTTTTELPERIPPGALRKPLEWPTLLIAVATYAGFLTLTWFYHALPLWLVIPAGAWLLAWHGSLQHEAMHGHPSRRPWLNELLVFPSLWLWMPYRTYRDTHLAHHRDERLTDPLDDPESYYMTAEQWQRLGPVMRVIMQIRNTVAGRLLLGPMIAVWYLWRHQMPRLLRGERRALKTWGLHAVACSLVLGWVIGACGIPLLEYLAFFVYPSIALTLLRSFAEHRAEENPHNRSVVVDAAWPLALLFLNNNLHWLHHREPGTPWYSLPRRYRDERDAVLAANGNYRFRGYGEIVGRYLLKPKEPVVHPAYETNDRTNTTSR